MRTEALPADPGGNEEVSLVDLVRVLARRRWWVIAGVVACLAGGLSYLLLVSPRYEIRVQVNPPYDNEIASLNLGRTRASGLDAYSAEQVFDYFIREALSDRAFQRFFNELYLPTLSEEGRRAPEARLYKQAQALLAVTVPDAQQKEHRLTSVTIAADTPEKALRWTTGFLDRVVEDARKTLTTDVRAGLDVAIRNTKTELEELRLTAQRKRIDRIAQLEEALAVANAVGLRDPQVTAARPPSSDSLSPFVDGTLLYARGAKSLSAELRVLKTRENDDPFISELRDAESRLRMLSSLLPGDLFKFSVHRLDGEIVTPIDPVKPRKALTMALALIVGLVSGVALALVAEAVSNARSAVRTVAVPASECTSNRR